MPHTMLQTTEDIISDILNCVCPECGGPMGKRSKELEFKCQGECRTDWRGVWERSLRATTPQHLRPANSNGSEIQDDPPDREESYRLRERKQISEYSHSTATNPKGRGAPHLQEH